jgi:hypothetical protein
VGAKAWLGILVTEAEAERARRSADGAQAVRGGLWLCVHVKPLT